MVTTLFVIDVTNFERVLDGICVADDDGEWLPGGNIVDIGEYLVLCGSDCYSVERFSGIVINSNFFNIITVVVAS